MAVIDVSGMSTSEKLELMRDSCRRSAELEQFVNTACMWMDNYAVFDLVDGHWVLNAEEFRRFMLDSYDKGRD